MEYRYNILCDLSVCKVLGEVGVERGQLIQGAVGGAGAVTEDLGEEEGRERHLHYNTLKYKAAVTGWY